MSITRFESVHFRSFRDFELDVNGGSTVAICENAGGKTSLLTWAAQRPEAATDAR